MTLDEELEEFIRENRYVMGRRLGPDRFAAVGMMTFGKGRLMIGDKYCVETAY